MPNIEPSSWRDNENSRVILPKSARACLKHHRFVPGDRDVPAHYVEVPYEYAEYPKTLYHPHWNTVPEPQLEQYRDAVEFRDAHRQWLDSSSARTLVANNRKDEDRLVKMGWLLQRPERAARSDRKNPEEL